MSPVRSTGALAPALSLILLMSGCATGPAAPVGPPVGCEALATMTVPAGAIGLPTRGATVTSATVVAAGGTGASAIGDYCKVTADIAPVDPAAPRIRLQVDLPMAWNGKVLMFGGGGYDGTIPNVAGNVPAGPADRLLPLGRGYATFASDSGHQAGPLGSRDGSFGVNDEAVANFSGDALKKTRDVAVAIVTARYGVAKPDRAYFAGGSSGGREALAVVQRWPQDWDGAIVLYPAGAAASLDLQFGRFSRAFAAPGAYPNVAKRKRLYDAALEACDGLDGVVDGLVSNMRACNALFDPAKATIVGTPLRCPGGGEGGDTCLSDAQITALKVFDTPITFTYPLASGETQYPGFNVWGTDLGIPNASPLQATVTLLSFGSSPPASVMPSTVPYGSLFWDHWVKYFVTRDPQFDALSLDPQNPGPWQARISALTALQDVNKTDLTPFLNRGGKILNGPRPERRARQHARDRAVLRPAAQHDGTGAGRELRALLRDSRLRPCGQHGLQRRVGLADDARELGRARHHAAAADGRRHGRGTGPHPTAVPVPGLPALRRQRRHRAGVELHLRRAVAHADAARAASRRSARGRSSIAPLHPSA